MCLDVPKIKGGEKEEEEEMCTGQSSVQHRGLQPQKNYGS